MSYNFLPSSKRAVEMQSKPSKKHKFPWNDLPVGMSFGIEEGKISFGNLRSRCSKESARLGRRFRAVDHGEGSNPRFEVARLPDPENEPVNAIEANFKPAVMMPSAPAEVTLEQLGVQAPWVKMPNPLEKKDD